MFGLISRLNMHFTNHITKEVSVEDSSAISHQVEPDKEAPKTPPEKPVTESNYYESLRNQINKLKLFWAKKNHFDLDFYSLKIQELSEKDELALKAKIESQFRVKNLPKGATEVCNALAYTDLHQDQVLYIVNYLDLAYEEALLKILSQVKRTLKVIRLEKHHLSLVHEVIKDLNLKSTARNNSRRPFHCRLFIA